MANYSKINNFPLFLCKIRHNAEPDVSLRYSAQGVESSSISIDRPDARTSPQPSTSESPREPENSRPDRTPQQIQLQQSLAAANLVSSESPEQQQAENDESRDQEESQLMSADSVSADGGAADDDQVGQARGRGPPVNMNLMQRMTDALSRMLNDPSTRLAMRTLSEREASRFVKLSFCIRLYNRSRFFRLLIRLKSERAK